MTKLEVINNAMLKCGLPLSANLADADYNALQVYELCVEEALSSHAWSFARGYRKLELIENDEAAGNRYAYKLPEDYLALIDVRRSPDLRSPVAREVERAGDVIYCQVNPAFLCYTKKVYDPEMWSASFAEAVAALIAVKICGLSAEKMQMMPQLMQVYNLQLSIAQGIDARESRTRLPGNSQFLEARKIRD